MKSGAKPLGRGGGPTQLTRKSPPQPRGSKGGGVHGPGFPQVSGKGGKGKNNTHGSGPTGPSFIGK